MMGDCEDCPSHGLSLEDFKKGEQEEINEETEICHQVWKKDITGQLTKAKETRTIRNTLEL